MIDLRQGRWQEALADVGEVDAIITDPPYSARTHEGQTNLSALGRRELSYLGFSPSDARDFVFGLAPRVRGWWVVFSDSVLCEPYRAAFEDAGFCGFAPLPCVIPGMTVRLSGDGPSSWAVYANVARPRSRAFSKWGTLPGAYVVGVGERLHIGGKPLGLMRALVRDYSRPGDLICDPCAGGATTLIAAAMEGRRAVGSEMDPKTYALAQARIARGHTPDMFSSTTPRDSR